MTASTPTEDCVANPEETASADFLGDLITLPLIPNQAQALVLLWGCCAGCCPSTAPPSGLPSSRSLGSTGLAAAK